MARTVLVVVGDDQMMNEKAKSWGGSQGYTVKSMTQSEFVRSVDDRSLKNQVTGEATDLTMGHQNPVEMGAKILQFPGPGSLSTLSHDSADKKVRTINELESLAIENAIHEYGGNLTEAAKALGIGRATLYRKVKQYSIDPANARRKKAA